MTAIFQLKSSLFERYVRVDLIIAGVSEFHPNCRSVLLQLNWRGIKDKNKLNAFVLG